MPEKFQNILQEQFGGKEFETVKLTESIEAHRTALSDMSGSGSVRIPEGARIHVAGMSAWDQYEMGLLRLIAGAEGFRGIVTAGKENKDKGEHDMDHYAPQRFSESVGRFIEDGAPAIHVPSRLSEWLYDFAGGTDAAIDGVMRNKRLLEAAVTTSSMSTIVKNTVNLLLAAKYSVRHRWWEPIVTQADVETLDDVTLARTYGISGMNTMSEGDTYLEFSWGDDEETAEFVKRGGYIGVTQETFLRDKLNVLRNLPGILSDAWYNQVSSLVSAVFTCNTHTGPVLSDTGALFNATAATSAGGHVNLLTAALSHAAYAAAKLSMRKQTDEALGTGERLNAVPKYMLIPADLEQLALEIATSLLVPGEDGGATSGGQMQTKNVFEGDFTPIVVPHWTDVNNWALVADPKITKAIYLIWLRGRRTPELFSATSEVAGAMFTNDEIRF